MKPLMQRLDARLRHRSPLTLTGMGLLYVLAVAVVDRACVSAMTFSLFYLLGVALVAWCSASSRAMIVMALASAVALALEELVRTSGAWPVFVEVWNVASRLAVFLVGGWLAVAISRLTRGLQGLVDDRTAQWKAEAAEHKATEGRLAEAAERFEQVINNIDEVFWLSNVAKDQMVYVSPGYERIWGRTCEELYRKPKSWLAAVHPEDRELVARRAHTEQAGGRYDVEYRIIRPDGAVRWIRDRAFPVRNAAGEVWRVAGIADDITEQKEGREALQVQAAILESMAEGVVVTDEQGMIVQMNRAADQIWGYSPREVIGRPADVFSALPEPERAANMREVLTTLKTKGTWSGTFKNLHKDGRIIYCEAVMNRLELEGRTLYVAVEQDVTERKREEVAKETFLSLGATLNLVRTPLEAARAAYAAADRLWSWDSGNLNLYIPEMDRMEPVLYCDVVDGERREVPAPWAGGGPTPRIRVIMEHGAQLVLRQPGEAPDPTSIRYGDLSRASASIMSVPMRREGQAVGVLSLQSYTHNAYTPEDLRVLQALADYCSGALERIRTETALRESESSLRVFLDASPTPAFLLDREGRVVVSNPALLQRLSVSPEELKGRDVHELLPEEVGRSRRAVFHEVLRSGKPMRFEDERAGRHFLTFESPVLDAAGNVSRVAVLALDITERKEAERALAQKEELYRTLFELSPDGILLEDGEGNILDVNQALCRSFGYAREELAGRNVRCLVPPEGEAEVATHLAALRAGESLQHEVWNARKNGERFLMRLSEKPLSLPDGRQGILVVARDVTASRRAQETREAFLFLGTRLSTARSPLEVARAIYATADLLWNWDSASLDLYSPESNQVHPVLNRDVVDGQRREVPPVHPGGTPSAKMRRILERGAELILEDDPTPMAEFVAFGDTSRLSASLMYVPLRRGGQAVGVLSIQSYAPQAYTPEDLQTLQALADHCGGALERVRAEQALRESEERNHTILATAMDAFYALDFAADPGGAITQANESFCRLTGYSREELLQMRMADLEAAESPEEVARHGARIIATGEDRFETRHRRKDGREIHTELCVSRLGGRGNQVFGFVRDITERKRAELLKEAFLSLGARLSAANSAVEAAKAVFATADQLWKWDAAVLQLYSVERGCLDSVLLIDLVDGERREVPPPYPDSPPPPVMRRILQDGPELILRTPAELQGSEFVAFGNVERLSASLMYARLRREGQTIGVLSIQSYAFNAYTPDDLRTLQALADYCGGAVERVRAEESLREAHDQLEQRVRERTAELQAANTALRESESRLRLALDASNAGTWSWDAATNTSTWDERFHEQYGLEAGSAPLFEEWLGRMVPEDRERLGARIRALVAPGGGEVWNEQFRVLHPSKGERWMEGLGRVERDQAGRTVRVAGINLDITERKRAEEAQRSQLAQIQAIYETAPAGICLLDRNCRYLRINERLAAINGMPAAWHVGRTVREAVPQLAERSEMICRQIITTGREALNLEFEGTTNAQPGVIRSWLTHWTPLKEPDGRVSAISMFVEDVTERKRMDQVLRESEAKYRRLHETMTDAFVRVDMAGRIRESNRAYQNMVGYTEEELQRLTYVDLTPEKWHEWETRLVTEQIVARGYSDVYEKEYRRKDGTVLPVELRTILLRDEAGEPSGMWAIVRDISERKQAEKALREAHDKLEQRVRERTAELEAANAALREHENRFRAVFESSSDCILVWDRQYNYLYANQAAIDHVGTTRDKVIGQNIRSGLGHLPDFMRRWMGRVDRALERGESFRVQDAVPVGGRMVFSESQVSPIRDAAGRVFAVGVVYREVTERKRAEQELAEALDLNQRILAASPMGIAVFKASGECVFANEALATIAGGSVPKIMGLNFGRLPAWRRSGLLQLAKVTLSQGRPNAKEVHNVTTFGKEAWVDVHMAPFTRSGEPHLLCMYQDIGDRKRAEQALREAERLQKVILDNIPDPVWLKDVQGRFLAGNEALGSIHGRPLNAIIGKTVFEVVPREAHRMTCEDKEVLRTRRALRREAPFTDLRGRGRWFESIKAPLFNEQNKLVGTVGIAREITERKWAATLLQAQRDLGVGLSLADDLPAALKHLLDLTMHLGGIDAAGVYLTDPADDTLELVGHQGVSPAYVNAVSRWQPDTALLQKLHRGQAVFRSFSATLPANNPVLQREGLRATAFIPMCHGGAPIGALTVGSRVADEIPPQTRLVIEAIAAQAAGAIARIRAETERRYLERRVLEISDRQQARMGQEIHDGLCQHLVSLAFDANSLHRALSGRRQPEAKTARRIARYLDQAITEARQLSRGLFPVRLAEVGLPPALEELARAVAARFKLQCRFSSRGHVAVADHATATHLYRITQEALANAIKHSQARSVSIRLLANARRLELTIEDDGRGLPSGRQRWAPGLGLHIMEYRARTIGGTLRLRRGRRGGTVVCCCVPRRRGSKISA